MRALPLIFAHRSTGLAALNTMASVTVGRFTPQPLPGFVAALADTTVQGRALIPEASALIFRQL
jgi:hypothetical protein